MGACVAEIFEKFCNEENNPVKYGFSHLIDFWLVALRRIQPLNANVLTESVLLYTFSYLDGGFKNVFLNRSIVDYLDRHYAEADMNLRKVAGIFSYTQKYLSSLFKKKMNIGFCEYVMTLRIQYAQKIVENGFSEVSRLSEACGFCDAMYFSKSI